MWPPTLWLPTHIIGLHLLATICCVLSLSLSFSHSLILTLNVILVRYITFSLRSRSLSLSISLFLFSLVILEEKSLSSHPTYPFHFPIPTPIRSLPTLWPETLIPPIFFSTTSSYTLALAHALQLLAPFAPSLVPFLLLGLLSCLITTLFFFLFFFFRQLPIVIKGSIFFLFRSSFSFCVLFFRLPILSSLPFFLRQFILFCW